MLGFVWTHVVPFGTVAWRMNLLSAVCGAVAVAVLSWTTVRLTRSNAAALAAGLALGFSAGTKGLGDLAIGAVGDHTDVVVRLVGPWDNPKVKVELPGLGDAVAAVKEQVADAVSDAVARADELNAER